jgi:hypothetical protein
MLGQLCGSETQVPSGQTELPTEQVTSVGQSFAVGTQAPFPQVTPPQVARISGQILSSFKKQLLPSKHFVHPGGQI